MNGLASVVVGQVVGEERLVVERDAPVQIELDDVLAETPEGFCPSVVDICDGEVNSALDGRSASALGHHPPS